MVFSLTYRRPKPALPASSHAIGSEQKQRSIDESVHSSSSFMSHGIPQALSFDRILAGGVCPPCTTRDFMNFLSYIELAAENLQFYLWFRDYEKRFNELPDREKALSPEWTSEVSVQKQAPSATITTDPSLLVILQDTGLVGERSKKTNGSERGGSNPFSTPPHTPTSLVKRDESLDSNDGCSNIGNAHHAWRAAGAFRGAGLKWKPLTVQPYREEINRIISIYIADRGPRQLNLSSKERILLLRALQNTTHPSAFQEVVVTIEWSLRCQSHPNFIRWTICNSNRPRLLFARALGIGGILGGFFVTIILTLSTARRAWRVMAFISFFIGISTLIAAWKGMCVVLHGMHHRQLRPWELFTSESEPKTFNLNHESIETLGSFGSSISWEDEPWVAKYEKRNVVRKIFDREVWIQEPALRQIQNTIFLQAILGALIISGILVGIFLTIPKGSFF